ARRIAQAIDVPLIADADTGYGNPLNVIRTVQEYELAGVSAIHIEDQVTPKKCGHMENKQVIAASEMVEKIHAAVEARTSPDFLIIARTDARAMEGLDSALRPARMYCLWKPRKANRKSPGLRMNCRMCRSCSISRKAARRRRFRWRGSRNLGTGLSSFPLERCSRPPQPSEKWRRKFRLMGRRLRCFPS